MTQGIYLYGDSGVIFLEIVRIYQLVSLVIMTAVVALDGSAQAYASLSKDGALKPISLLNLLLAELGFSGLV